MSPAVIGVLIGSIIAFCIIGYVTYLGITSNSRYCDEFNTRRNNKINDFDRRQKEWHDRMHGAPMIEVVMMLEARIYNLEQELKRKQDDGK